MATMRMHTTIGATLALLLASVGLAAPTTASAAETPACGSFDVDLRQLIRPSSDVNLLTRWEEEGSNAENVFGFTRDNGVIAEVAGRDGTGLSAVYRLYKAGDFVWATEGSDVDELVQQGYQRQFVDFYAATTDTSCLDPIYRYSKGKIHRMATEAYASALEADGWDDEGVAFYAGNPAPSTPPPVEEDPEPVTVDTKFSIAVLPDTQNEFTSSTDGRFVNRAQWLEANKDGLDLRYSIQVGDLVNWGNSVPAQFVKASGDLKSLEKVTPWAPVIGNHDTAAVCAGGSACVGQNANEAVRNTTAMNTYFPVSRFPDIKGTFEPNKIDNSYHIFNAGGVQWMVLSLELWPRKAAVEWANDVVEANPQANVIIATHAYLDPDGSISGSNGGYGATSPRYVFDNLVKLHPNIKMVLSGHVGDSASRTDTGVAGNRIVSLLQCYHSTTNPVRLMEIDTKAGTVTSKVYAPGTGRYFTGDATSASGMSFVKLR